jgi:hypothetical protein
MLSYKAHSKCILALFLVFGAAIMPCQLQCPIVLFLCHQWQKIQDPNLDNDLDSCQNCEFGKVMEAQLFMIITIQL